MNFLRPLSAVLLVVCVVSTAHALPVSIAETSFEADEGYTPAGTDIRDYTPTDGAGWGSNTWAGNNGGDDYTPVLNDPASAFEGDQYWILHRERGGDAKREIRVRRKYDTSLIQDGRVAFGTAIRLDTSVGIGTGNYFDGGANIALEWGTSDNSGDKNVHIEFTDDGIAKARGADNGNDLVLGRWDDINGGVFAHNNWLTLLFDISIPDEKYDLYINDVLMGTDLDFRSGLDAGEELNQIRFFGPRAIDGNPNDGFSVDAVSLSTVPEPGSVLLLVAGSLLLGRRRR